MSEVNLKKVAGLLELLKTNHERSTALIDEIDELLGGGAGIGAQLKACEAQFEALWGRRYAQGETGRYVWRYKTDRPCLKRLIKALGVAEIQARMFTYLRSEDEFSVHHRHPFGLFVAGINSYAGEGVALELEAPPASDCQHTPRCRNDYIHTQRKRAEMRE